MEQPDLKAAIISGKTPLDPGSEVEGCVYSRKRHFHWKTGAKCLLQAGQLCLGQQALSRNIAVLNLWSNRKPLQEV